METLSDNSFLRPYWVKFLPYTISFIIVGLLYNVILFGFLHYPLNGNILWMFLDTILWIVASQCVGI